MDSSSEREIIDPRVYSAQSIKELTPAERKDLRRRGILPQAKQVQTYLRRQSQAISELELREAVMRGIRAGYPIPALAERIGRTKQKLYVCRRTSLKNAIKRAYDENLYGPVLPPEPPIPRRLWRKRLEKKRMSGLPPFALPPPSDPSPPGSPPPSSAPSGAVGEILDAPEVVQMRRDCLMLRKAMHTFDQMADLLGITNQEARQYTYEALQDLQQSELNNAELERRLMVEQLDEMIAAIHPLSTGKDLRNGKRPVILEAIDRSVKLLAKKAELLGLTQPPAVDIRLKLQELAADGNYDILDLEEIARSVLASHKIRLPEI